MNVFDKFSDDVIARYAAIAAAALPANRSPAILMSDKATAEQAERWADEVLTLAEALLRCHYFSHSERYLEDNVATTPLNQ